MSASRLLGEGEKRRAGLEPEIMEENVCVASNDC